MTKRGKICPPQPREVERLSMVLLIRSQPEQNIRRFYVVSLAPTLFGEWTVMREWGRIGQPGQLRSQTFTDHAEAAVAQQRSIKT